MKRTVLVFCAALVALLGSVTAALSTTAERDFMLRGYVDATQTAELPYRIPRLGVNADLTQYSAAELEQHIAWMQEANIHWIRQFVHWDRTEPAPGQIRWDLWDPIFSTVAKHTNIGIIPVFLYTPDWARRDPDAPRASPPHNPAELAKFIKEFARRYSEHIHYYQIWDEPNLYEGWGEYPNTHRYLSLLQHAYEAVHSADENAAVMAAALAPTVETGPVNVSDIVYLEGLYALGADQYMDVVAAKPYGFDFSPQDRTVSADVLNFSRIVALREIMVEHGDARKPLWASSFGWNSLPADWNGPPSIWGSVNEEQRVQFTLDALSRAEREWPWLGGMILQHWQPDAAHMDPVWGFSLIDQDDKRGPLWQVLSQLQPGEAAGNGLHHPTTPFARYSGIWTFGTLGADIGWLETSDSQFEFTFNGSDVALQVREGDYVAFLYAEVDGEPANVLPRDASGNSYIFLGSDTQRPEQTLVPVARNLVSGQHTLHVVADRGWDRWAIAGFAVSSGDLAIPYKRQINIAWIASALSLLAVVVVGKNLPLQSWFSRYRRIVRSLEFPITLGISLLSSIALMIGMLLTWNEASGSFFRRETLQLGVLLFLSAGLLVIQPGFLLTIAALLILFVFIYNRLENGLILTVFWAPFFLFPVELYRFAFPLAEVMILLTTMAWGLRGMASWARWQQSANQAFPLRMRLRLHTMDYFVAGWLVLALVSLLWTKRLDFALTELRVLIVEPCLFYMILRTSAPDERTLFRICTALVGAGILVSIVGLFQYATGIAFITAEEGTRRLASVYGSPNNVGLLLERVIPFIIAYRLLLAKLAWEKVASTAALLLMGVTALLTQSAGALFLGIPAAVATVLWLNYRNHFWRILVVLVVAGVVGMLLLTQISPRFVSLFDFTRGTNFIRLRLWESAVDVVRDYPLTGLGLDQFLYTFRGEYIRPDAVWDPDLSHPHNFVLDFWIRLGLPGLLWFLAVQSVYWRGVLYHLLQARHNTAVSQALSVGSAGAMAGLLAHGLIDNSVFVQDLAYIFVLLLALSANLHSSTNTRAIDASVE